MTATLLTTDELLEHVESDLGDDALQRILDSEEGEIVRRYGTLGTVTEQRLNAGPLIVLSQRAASITSVSYFDAYTEYPIPPIGGDATQYYRLANGSTLELFGWSAYDRLTITYVPEDTTEQRRVVLIALCKLALAYSGYSNQNDPSGGENPLDYTREREALLRTLRPRTALFA